MVLVALLAVTSINAQDLKGKNGQPILPEAGDIGLGFNAIPFLNWFGNSFNGSSNNTYAGSNKFFNMFGNSVIMGKYMLSESSAIRANIGFNFTSVSENQFIFDDAAVNDPLAMVEDTRISTFGRYTLAGGYEMRRGTGRIQGYFGGDVILSLTEDYTEYRYGNGYSTTNAVPTAYNWGGNINSDGSRDISSNGTTFGLGIRPFIGVEYFVAPKMSIGAEFGWTLQWTHGFRTTDVAEYYELSTGNTVNTENMGGATNIVSGNVDNFNGAVFLLFYF